MKNTTIRTIEKTLQSAITKSQESTAMLRASVQLYINDSKNNVTLSTMTKDIKAFNVFGEKTLKNCIRFSKLMSKDKNIKKLGIKALIEMYMKPETRKAYDELCVPNRKKQAETKQAETKQAETKQAETKQAETKQAETKQSNHVQSKKSDVELYIDSLTLEELKQAYHIIRNKLGVKTTEENIKKINAIKKIAC